MVPDLCAQADFTAIVVQQDDRYIAALPLVADTTARLFTVYRLTSNCTVSAGDLLIDPDCDVAIATQLLASRIAQLRGTLAAFEGIEIESPRWQQLIAALQNGGRELHVSRGFDVGVVDILHDWDAYSRSWSRNHRSAIKRSQKKLEAEGEIQVQRLRDPSDEELYETLETCFSIEDRGWKGENGTSILRTPGLRQYCHQEARMVRDLGMLDLWLLKVNDQTIAFEYCHFAKSTCFSHKISFDPAWERFSPGRLLRCYQLQSYHQDLSARHLDTLGVLCEAKAKWITRSYKSSRCFVAVGSPWSNVLLRSFKAAKGIAGRIRGDDAPESPIEPGAARYLELADKSKRPGKVAASYRPPVDSPSTVPQVATSTS